MANNSMNNWLGFSLSPQHPPPPPPQVFNSDEISDTHVASGYECFASTLPSLNLQAAPFGLLESFNTNNNLQDWNSSTTSQLSMLLGSSSSCTSHSGPKLENFLGITNGDHHYMYQNCCSLQLQAEAAETTTSGGGGIGLSTMKNWLRNNPAPPPQPVTNGGTLNGTAQTLSLSMSTGSQSSSLLPLLAASSGGDGGGVGGEGSSSDNNNNKRQTLEASHSQTTGAIEAVPRKSIDTLGQRTSIYRANWKRRTKGESSSLVSMSNRRHRLHDYGDGSNCRHRYQRRRHRWTGRYEAHLWDNSCRREGQTRKGRQVYLGGYDKEDKAARSYDLAALKYWGTTTTTNFPISNYEKEVEEMKHMTRQEYVASLRRKSSGFSRGASIYRGVTRHHQHGRWQARIGRVAGNKDLYLGTFSKQLLSGTQEEAAEAYDIAAIKFRGLNAVTNFEMNRYDVKTILESSTLPIGGAAKRLKEAEHAEMTLNTLTTENNSLTSYLTDGIPSYGTSHHNNWPNIAFQQAQPLPMNFPYDAHQRLWCKQEIPDTDTSGQSYQNLQQIQLANNTHNFLQPSVMHNLINLDSSSLEHRSGSNSVMYGNSGGYGVPMGTILAQEGNQNPGFGESTYENPSGATDHYNLRNLCHLSQHSLNGSVKPSSVYDQGSACNNWIPTAVPALAPKTNSMAVSHGAPTFIVWNDT